MLFRSVCWADDGEMHQRWMQRMAADSEPLHDAVSSDPDSGLHALCDDNEQSQETDHRHQRMHHDDGARVPLPADME